MSKIGSEKALPVSGDWELGYPHAGRPRGIDIVGLFWTGRKKRYDRLRTLHYIPPFGSKVVRMASKMENPNCPISKTPERRRAFRTPYRTPVRYANATGNGAGTVKDLSSEGLFMETPGPLDVGEKISISFQFRNSKHPMDIDGEITRRDFAGVGVKFIWS
jgi:hypothetical protein